MFKKGTTAVKIIVNAKKVLHPLFVISLGGSGRSVCLGVEVSVCVCILK